MMQKETIRKALNQVAERLSAEGIYAEICIYGGSALVLSYELRKATQDIDFRLLTWDPKTDEDDLTLKKIRQIIDSVGESMNLPLGWMNDGVKGFISPYENSEGLIEIARGEGESETLRIFVPTLKYLLAMKCMSMRTGKDSHDKEDIRVLIDMLGLTDLEDVLRIVEEYFPAKFIQPKTEYGLREIFSSKEGRFSADDTER